MEWGSEEGKNKRQIQSFLDPPMQQQQWREKNKDTLI